MGTVRKIGDEYYIEFYARGLLYQQKAGKDKRKAEVLLQEVETKIQQGEMGTMVRDVDLDVFWETFKRYTHQTYSPPTHLRFQDIIGDFQAFQQKEFPRLQKLSEVTPRIMERYRLWLEQAAKISHPPLKRKTLNFRLRLMREIWKYAITLGYLNDNPAFHTKFFDDRDNIVPLTLSVDEQNKLLACCEDPLKYGVEFILATGVLWGELVQLKWEDVNTQERTIKVMAPLGSKTIVPQRSIPIDHKAHKILEGCKGKDRTYIFPFPKQGGEAVALPQFSFCLLRHTFAREVLKKGIDLFDLNKLFGYCDIARVMRYACFHFERSEK